MLGRSMRSVGVVVAAVFALLIGLSAASAQTNPSEQPAQSPHALIESQTTMTTTAAAAMQPHVDLNDQPHVEASLVEFIGAHFRAHEPMYLLYGSSPDTKLQISLKYQFISDGGPITKAAPWASDFYFGYTQTSLWEIGSDSVDTTFRPELMYLSKPRKANWLAGMSRFDLQAGMKRESNGQSGADSRGLNIAYISPILTFGDDAMGDDGGGAGGGFFVAVAPRVWAYFGDTSENPDIYQYRGYGDVSLVAGWRGGFQTAVSGGFGNDWDKGWLEVDFSYPLQKLGLRDLGMYLHAQVFTGYGESLLTYNESTTTFRMGVSLVR